MADGSIDARIARREIRRVLARSGIRRRQLTVDVDPDVLSLLLREGYSLAFGARPLKRTVERLVLLPLARAIASGEATDGSIVRLRARARNLDVEVSPPSAAATPASPAQAAAADPRMPARRSALEQRIEALRTRAAPLAEHKVKLLEQTTAQSSWADHALLVHEAGLHEVTRGAKPRDERAKRARVDDDARPSDRDVVRVEVLAAPTEARPFARPAVRIDVRPLARGHERLAEPRWEITALHVPTMIALQVWSESKSDAALARLGGYLRARVDAAAAGVATTDAIDAPSAASPAIVRRYALGPTPFVRDLRSGRRTSKVDRVLEGRIEEFLVPAREP
jgi:hypothetical protein